MIEHYEFGRITIDGQTHTSDVIIWPEGVDDTWWRAAGHSLCEEDLVLVLDKKPDVLIIGTGAAGVMQVPPETVRYLRARCSEVHIMRTEQACAVYNKLTNGKRRVVAALHLTC